MNLQRLILGLLFTMPTVTFAVDAWTLQNSIEGYFEYHFGRNAIVARRQTGEPPVDLDWDHNGRPNGAQGIVFELGYVEISNGLICRLGIGYAFPGGLDHDIGLAPAVFTECVPIIEPTAADEPIDLSVKFAAAKDHLLARFFDLRAARLPYFREVWGEIASISIVREASALQFGLLFYVNHPIFDRLPTTDAVVPVHYDYRFRNNSSPYTTTVEHSYWSLSKHKCKDALRAGSLAALRWPSSLLPLFFRRAQ